MTCMPQRRSKSCGVTCNRYRNAHLIAGVTAHLIAPILKYLQPTPIVAAAAASMITAVNHADPDADRRSKEQADALSQALTLAVAGKHNIKRYANGESRRPTVTEARAYVHEVSGAVGKLHSDLADALSALHSDPHADVTRGLEN